MIQQKLHRLLCQQISVGVWGYSGYWCERAGEIPYSTANAAHPGLYFVYSIYMLDNTNGDASWRGKPLHNTTSRSAVESQHRSDQYLARNIFAARLHSATKDLRGTL